MPFFFHAYSQLINTYINTTALKFYYNITMNALLTQLLDAETLEEVRLLIHDYLYNLENVQPGLPPLPYQNEYLPHPHLPCVRQYQEIPPEHGEEEEEEDSDTDNLVN